MKTRIQKIWGVIDQIGCNYNSQVEEIPITKKPDKAYHVKVRKTNNELLNSFWVWFIVVI